MRHRYAMAIMMLGVAAGSARAADWEADPTRTLGDPAYLPLAGQVAGYVSVNYLANTYDDAIYPGSRVNSEDRSAFNVLPYASYGVTDDISISLQIDWESARNQETFITTYPVVRGGKTVRLAVPGRYATRSVGAEDPTIGGTWRVADQRRGAVNIDLTVQYAPDIFAARASGADQVGTTASGGQRGTVQVSVSRGMQYFSVDAYAILGYEGRRILREAGDAGEFKAGARPDFTLGAASRIVVLPWLGVLVGLQGMQTAQTDEVTSGPFGSTATTLRPGSTLDPFVGLLVPLVRDRLVWESRYDHEFNAAQKVIGASGTAGRTFDNATNLYTTRLRFVFF